MDKFPEAFRRFERVVNIRRIRSFSHLHSAFSSWAGTRWHDTSRQKYALAREAKDRGFYVPLTYFRRPEKERSAGFRIHVKVDSFTRRSRVVYVLRDIRTGRFISEREDQKPEDTGKEE